ncbi:unnamed protein product [Prorocentrum cordatum]|uniref:DNA (cytosine-5-)-methyltransferase n=1 Tax=Prorocentrum cordatum TaxID=2364126 RepID=A0ABN9WIV1_9DINO|nr:unnamed protein product [Polarella glacialis]
MAHSEDAPLGSPECPTREPEPFVLLALFDGIRGCSVALQSLGLLPHADYSSEVDSNCQRLIAQRFPQCVQLGDIRKIDAVVLERLVDEHGTAKPWLVVGGSPCQDLSKRKRRTGRSILIIEVENCSRSRTCQDAAGR